MTLYFILTICSLLALGLGGLYASSRWLTRQRYLDASSLFYGHVANHGGITLTQAQYQAAGQRSTLCWREEDTLP